MNIEIIKRSIGFSEKIDANEMVQSILIYLRKSRKDNDYYKEESTKKTLERHEQQLQEWSISTLGMKIPEENIFREIVSGDTIEDRPMMQEILTKIESNQIKAVLCIEIERLARGNTIDQGIIAQTFQYSNTKIITPNKIYNLDNEDDLSYFEDGLYQSRKYLLYIKKILKRGRIRSVKEGKYISSCSPYGYDRKKLNHEKGFTLEINEKEAQIVNFIANLYAYGMDTIYQVKENDTISSIAKIYSMKKKELISCNPNSQFKYGDKIDIKTIMGFSAIATYLNYLKITPKIARQWSPNMIRNILTSPSIYGYVTWGARETVNIIRDGELFKTRPRNHHYLKVKGNFEAILKENDERTKIILQKNKQKNKGTIPKSYDLKNPLAGLLICPFCHKKMVRRPLNKNNSFDTIYCKTARCKTVGSSLKLIEKRILYTLELAFENYHIYVDNYDIQDRLEISTNKNLLPMIDNEVHKLKGRREKCYELLEDGTYSKELFSKRIEKIENDIIELENKKEEIIIIQPIKEKFGVKKMVPILNLLSDIYKKCNTIKEKHELLCSLVEYIIYLKTKGGRGYEDKFELKIKLKI